MQHEYQEAYSETSSAEETVSSRKTSALRLVVVQSTLIILGLVFLILGSHWLVTGATVIARKLEISELVIGLTIVSAGTSLPEVTTSIVAALKGERDIAVGNVVGSNIFNLSGVLGLASIVNSSGIPVTRQAFYFDLPVMLLSSLLVLLIFQLKSQLNRGFGILMLSGYLGYTIYLITCFSAIPDSLITACLVLINLLLFTATIVSCFYLKKTR
ncbi:MAG: hypothetical protein R3C11_11095 [Planctomycetaceae bacterium]